MIKVMKAHATASLREHRGYPVGNLPCHGWEGPCSNTNAAHQRQNTAYVDDACNWVTLCPECMKWCDEYWDERWSEYYSGCL